MRKIVFVVAIACVATAAAFGTGCTTTKIVVATPTSQMTPTLSPDQLAYVQSVATQAARPTDTPVPPTSTPAPPTQTPVVIYVPAAPAAPAPPPAHDAVDDAYKQQIMDNCMGTIGFRPQCVCITTTLVQDADRLGWTYRKVYDAWVSSQSGALTADQFKQWIADVGLTPCFNY